VFIGCTYCCWCPSVYFCLGNFIWYLTYALRICGRRQNYMERIQAYDNNWNNPQWGSLKKLYGLNVKFLLASIYGFMDPVAWPVLTIIVFIFGNNDYNQTVVPYFYFTIIFVTFFGKFCKYGPPVLFSFTFKFWNSVDFEFCITLDYKNYQLSQGLNIHLNTYFLFIIRDTFEKPIVNFINILRAAFALIFFC